MLNHITTDNNYDFQIVTKNAEDNKQLLIWESEPENGIY